MTSYVRPLVDTPLFRDADGAVIAYGNRWDGSPPEETYSVDTHPERFAPLHVVADALIAHLRETYDVDVDDGPETAGDLMRPAFHDVVRAVRVRPRDPNCAVLTFVFTAYPGIYLHAGLLHDFPYPICGCDACDSTWEAEAGELERQVLATVNGNYRETIDGGRRPAVHYAVTVTDGGRSGTSFAEDIPAPRLEDAKAVLDALPGGWAAWPRLASPCTR